MNPPNPDSRMSSSTGELLTLLRQEARAHRPVKHGPVLKTPSLPILPENEPETHPGKVIEFVLYFDRKVPLDQFPPEEQQRFLEWEEKDDPALCPKKPLPVSKVPSKAPNKPLQCSSDARKYGSGRLRLPSTPELPEEEEPPHPGKTYPEFNKTNLDFVKTTPEDIKPPVLTGTTNVHFGETNPDIVEPHPYLVIPRPVFDPTFPEFYKPKSGFPTPARLPAFATLPAFGRTSLEYLQLSARFGEPRPQFGDPRPRFGDLRPQLYDRWPQSGERGPQFVERRTDFGNSRPRFDEPLPPAGQWRRAFETTVPSVAEKPPSDPRSAFREPRRAARTPQPDAREKSPRPAGNPLSDYVNPHSEFVRLHPEFVRPHPEFVRPAPGPVDPHAALVVSYPELVNHRPEFFRQHPEFFDTLRELVNPCPDFVVAHVGAGDPFLPRWAGPGLPQATGRGRGRLATVWEYTEPPGLGFQQHRSELDEYPGEEPRSAYGGPRSGSDETRRPDAADPWGGTSVSRPGSDERCREVDKPSPGFGPRQREFVQRSPDGYPEIPTSPSELIWPSVEAEEPPSRSGDARPKFLKKITAPRPESNGHGTQAAKPYPEQEAEQALDLSAKPSWLSDYGRPSSDPGHKSGRATTPEKTSNVRRTTFVPYVPPRARGSPDPRTTPRELDNAGWAAPEAEKGSAKTSVDPGQDSGTASFDRRDTLRSSARSQDSRSQPNPRPKLSRRKRSGSGRSSRGSMTPRVRVDNGKAMPKEGETSHVATSKAGKGTGANMTASTIEDIRTAPKAGEQRNAPLPNRRNDLRGRIQRPNGTSEQREAENPPLTGSSDEIRSLSSSSAPEIPKLLPPNEKPPAKPLMTDAEGGCKPMESSSAKAPSNSRAVLKPVESNTPARLRRSRPSSRRGRSGPGNAAPEEKRETETEQAAGEKRSEAAGTGKAGEEAAAKKIGANRGGLKCLAAGMELRSASSAQEPKPADFVQLFPDLDVVRNCLILPTTAPQARSEGGPSFCDLKDLLAYSGGPSTSY